MTTSPEIVLHHLNNSRSQRILWLLEELGLAYTVKHYQRDAKTNLAPAALKDVHALGRSPVLTHGDLVLAESGAIIEFLVDTYAPHLKPASTADLIQYRFWMHFAEGSLMPPLVARLVLGKAREKAGPFFIKPIVNKLVDGIIAAYYGPNLEQSLKYVNDYLSDHEWFAGDALSGADFQMSFPLEAMQGRVGKGLYPGIDAFVQQIHAREAYQRGLEKGGEYAYA
ncbi:MAG: glutathione S-transferase [Pseudomonadota bacterium]|jgi:glutathione S-transferase|uniref:glutathione S-transferase n=1 Tax=Marisediminitalea TaxID=2662254 RepID=UPI0020CEE37E|nr:glutathione S-transferase [Marisediminitalea aggregata]MCP3862945.1 glutathione S-transferase [Aestuariibacter sp.]MEC8227888.1 glutathione S-transferase [Pseudomonadota bacterium]MCP4529348.1 glutathione S-transferase [Aestuariibacter sp.]MCP4949878.1 glutathione S-transferase [Aestuariibacter sp.]MCP9476945.1 glutathione S-transferase [Marisediminitalea aggregata]